ncbi:VOC family protein [Sphingobium aromaticiconvertens]|uniref:VOC family protein n=1 Tax=Sphingobium aromaticiconvertens TaxID=365341 RepID=UPI00301AB4EE
MKPIAGATPFNQIAYVVDDLDAGVKWWTEVMGVGPFMMLRDLVYDESDLHGESMILGLHAAIAYSGDINIELIQPVGRSIFAEWREAGREGMHHTCVFTDDFAATEKDVLARGGKRLQGGRISGGIIGYYAMGGDQGVILEVAQLGEGATALFGALRHAARTWDGKNPHFTITG